MVANSIPDIETILHTIAKSRGIKILKALKERERTQKEISNITQTDKAIVSRRLREFVELGIVNERFDHQERVLKYSLTEFGKRVLKGLEALECVVTNDKI